jgi:hypothetical protein
MLPKRQYKEISMLQLQEIAPMDGISEALHNGRRSLAAIDRDSVGADAMSAARAVLPSSWFRPKPRRWPFVAGFLVVAALAAALFLFRQPLVTMSEAPKTGKPTPRVRPEPDASDVVTGPVGSSKLRDPAISSPEGADLSRLPEIEVDPDDGQGTSAIVG